MKTLFSIVLEEGIDIVSKPRCVNHTFLEESFNLLVQNMPLNKHQQKIYPKVFVLIQNHSMSPIKLWPLHMLQGGPKMFVFSSSFKFHKRLVIFCWFTVKKKYCQNFSYF